MVFKFVSTKPLEDYPWFCRILFHLQKKRFGKVLIPTLLWSRVPSLNWAFILFYQLFQRKKSWIAKDLQSLVMLRVAQVHQCSFCIDLNGLFLSERMDNDTKLLEVSNWKQSTSFSDREKLALEYAEAMTQTECEVEDSLREKLKKHFSDEALIELTALISFQNLSARFNAALGVSPQGLCSILNTKEKP